MTEESKIIKPVIRYTGIKEFNDFAKEFSRKSLEYVFRKDSWFEDMELITECKFDSPFITKSKTFISPNIYPEENEYKLGLQEALMTGMLQDQLEQLGLSEEVGDDSLLLLGDKNIYTNVTDRRQFNDLENLAINLIRFEGRMNNAINEMYLKLGLSNTKEHIYEINLGSAKIPEDYFK